MARRFQATQQSTVKDLQRVMGKINATSLRIDQDIMGGGVKVIFDRSGKRYIRECTYWQESLDNLRAIGLQIEYLYRALEVYNVDMQEETFNREFDNIFSGFLAPPDDNAFRALSKIHHPDNGGQHEDFLKLRAAYDQGMKSAKN